MTTATPRTRLTSAKCVILDGPHSSLEPRFVGLTDDGSLPDEFTIQIDGQAARAVYRFHGTFDVGIFSYKHVAVEEWSTVDVEANKQLTITDPTEELP